MGGRVGRASVGRDMDVKVSGCQDFDPVNKVRQVCGRQDGSWAAVVFKSDKGVLN
jgi:hypothetical protein